MASNIGSLRGMARGVLRASGRMAPTGWINPANKLSQLAEAFKKKQQAGMVGGLNRLQGMMGRR